MPNANPQFVRCPSCQRANPANTANCRNCNSTLTLDKAVSANPYSSPPFQTKRKRTVFGYILGLIVLIPLFFTIKWAASYGQVSVEKLENSDLPRRESKEVLPDTAWYKRTLKSWIWSEPSIEDILAKDIERAGGWKALEKIKSIEIEAERYGNSCDTLSAWEISSPEMLVAAKPTAISGKFEVPNKFYRLETRGSIEEGQQLFKTISNGTSALSCYFANNTEWACETLQPGSVVNGSFSFLTAATDYTKLFTNFSPVELDRYKNRVVYSTSASSKYPLPPDGVSRRDLLFDVITGRLIAYRFSRENVVRFDEFQKVGEVTLPHRICVEGDMNEALVIKSWKLNAPVDDTIFEQPTN